VIIMGWLKHILLGDIGQSLDIIETRDKLHAGEAARRMQRSAQSRNEMEIARLKARTEQLHLAITSLTRHLLDKKLIDESEFREFLDHLDLEDGKADGRLPFADELRKPKLIVPEAPRARGRKPV